MIFRFLWHEICSYFKSNNEQTLACAIGLIKTCLPKGFLTLNDSKRERIIFWCFPQFSLNGTKLRLCSSLFYRSFTHSVNEPIQCPPTRAPQSPDYSHTVIYSNWSHRAFNTYSVPYNWYWHDYARPYPARSTRIFNTDEPMHKIHQHKIQKQACIMFAQKGAIAAFHPLRIF